MRTVQNEIVNPGFNFSGDGRFPTKGEHARAYIQLFRDKQCDDSAFGENRNVRILPFSGEVVMIKRNLLSIF